MMVFSKVLNVGEMLKRYSQTATETLMESIFRSILRLVLNKIKLLKMWSFMYVKLSTNFKSNLILFDSASRLSTHEHCAYCLPCTLIITGIAPSFSAFRHSARYFFTSIFVCSPLKFDNIFFTF